VESLCGIERGAREADCRAWHRHFLPDHDLRAFLKMWRRASRPAVEGGILPPEPSLEPANGLIQPATQLVGVFSAGPEARLYVSQDGRRYIFR